MDGRYGKPCIAKCGYKVIKLKSILNEEASKKLRIFDFDDTIAKSNSRIKVTHQDGSYNWLTPGEYAVYDKKPGDVMDYSEFKKLIQPREIKAITKVLRNFYQAGGSRRITILTARGTTAPIERFMKKIGIQNIEVVGVDSSDPQKKADWIEEKIQQGYNDIFFADDSPKNIQAVQKLKEKYPLVKWQIKLVRYS